MSLFQAQAAAQDEIQGLVQFAFLRRPLAELLLACAEASLSLIVLKGAALAETLYPRPSLRPFGDIDVLVRPADAPRAFTLLSALGYTTDPAAWADLLRGRSFEANFFRGTGSGPVVIELHTSLLNNSLFFLYVSLDLDALWSRAKPARLAGESALVLGPEDQMLHLCLHLAGHYLAATRSLQDIFQLCSVAEVGAVRLDWPLVLRLASDARAEIACFCSLSAAKELLGASVPAEVIDALAPRSQRGQVEALAKARAGDTEHTEHLRLPLLWHLMGDNRARLGAARRILFPLPQWLLLHYYYDLFDSAEPPPPRSLRYFLVLVLLWVVHAGSLIKRSLVVLLKRAA